MDSASQIESNCGQKVLEIYGSSETGGIAWRQGVNNEFWTLFDGLKITQDTVDESFLASPYLVSKSPYLLDDKIELLDHCTFNLLGRKDRIVKVEEKRLSLDELEHHLSESLWIQQVHVLLLTGKRDKIAAILVLTDSGSAYIQQHGREQLIKKLRQQLLNSFESVVLPRKWLFMQSFPLNPQGKIKQSLLIELLLLDSLQFPQILDCDIQEKTVGLTFRILPKLICFTGHFPQHPILPGVIQLSWVESFGKIFFNIDLPFLCMEVIKFKKIICPADIIQMKLTWKPDSAKLYFELNSKTNSHSSGRMVYGTQS
jgi:3-hydroxymyristoyl/3-hydroxydecanoyl-(acyl carrier protein) dehydratase